MRWNGRIEERREISEVSGEEGGRFLEVANGGECYMEGLWVGDVGADS